MKSSQENEVDATILHKSCKLTENKDVLTN